MTRFPGGVSITSFTCVLTKPLEIFRHPMQWIVNVDVVFIFHQIKPVIFLVNFRGEKHTKS